MTKRMKATPPKPRSGGWEVVTETKINGRHVTKGTELTIRDHHGRNIRARFIEHVTSDSGATWITVAEIERKSGTYRSTRSFSLDKVKTVHTKTTQPRPKGRKARSAT